MVNERRLGVAGVLLAPALVLLLSATAAGCGDADNVTRSSSSPVPSASGTTPSTTPTSSSAAPTSTGGSGVSAGHPGRLLIVPADRLAGRCPKQRPEGVVCQGPSTVYRFQPEALRAVAAVRAEAAPSQAGQWAVEIELDAPSSRRLAAVTRDAARAHEYVLVMSTRRGPVITGAQVMTPIKGGRLQIAGLQDASAAGRIVNQVTKTAR